MRAAVLPVGHNPCSTAQRGASCKDKSAGWPAHASLVPHAWRSPCPGKASTHP